MSTPLNELVKNYKEKFMEKFEEQLEKFKEIEDYDELIYHSVFKIGSDDKVLAQDNILRFNMANNMYQCLKDDLIKEKISNSLCFTDILDTVYSLRRNNIIKYFGPLNLYDCSLRIGAHYNIYPSRVYVHCGSITGAKNLFKNKYDNIIKYYNSDNSFPYIPINSLPEELQNLEPHYIEDFLCKFATSFENIDI
ncbi:hypothetical protein [Clostridium aciditolerans]|uniref:Uncharacterized protein n=1 Tax=Clostridium aciditolerans TaxID=339861 RepID=A0A934HVW3_9CLOT|nr:hypothetical protein [Clostridium aciditolerans]MBI6875571.1 hypothetical protein [Clostridium aciditolerans]